MTNPSAHILTLITATLFFSFGLAQSISGTFVGADAAHQGAGSFQILEDNGERIIEFSQDFASTRGPDLFVWLTQGEDTSERVNLGRLQSATGEQRYTVPEDVNLEDFDRVIIWCRAFSILFSTAEFQTNN